MPVLLACAALRFVLVVSLAFVPILLVVVIVCLSVPDSLLVLFVTIQIKTLYIDEQKTKQATYKLIISTKTTRTIHKARALYTYIYIYLYIYIY